MNNYLPSSIMHLVKKQGFSVIEKSPKKDDIACIIRDENDGVVKFIYVNSTLPSPRKRFLVALAFCYYKMDAYENEKYYRRISLKDHPDEEVLRATMHLLLPDDLLIDIVSKGFLVEDKIEKWADVLDVEPIVLKYRLREVKRRRNYER